MIIFSSVRSVHVARQTTRPGGRNAHGNQSGFTFIELVMVIVMLGFLASVAIQKMLSMAETTEITVEDTTISTLRSNLIATMGENLIQRGTRAFSTDPFFNLTKAPDGYDRNRRTQPSGAKLDNDLWVYVLETGAGTGLLTPEETGTTLPDFHVDGFIYHQRKDQTVVRWAYDSASGVISKRLSGNTSASSDR